MNWVMAKEPVQDMKILLTESLQWSHSTQAQSMVSHCQLSNLMGEYMYIHVH